MGCPATLLCSKLPLCIDPRGVSSRHFHKYSVGDKFHLPNRLVLTSEPLKTPVFPPSVSLSSKFRRTHLLQPLRCSASTDTNSGFEKAVSSAIKSFSFESAKTTLSKLTPIDVCKLCGVLAIVTSVSKWTLNTLFSPFFWMYFSWSWSYWPWFAALALGYYGFYCFRKHSRKEANGVEQIAIVTAAFIWLTLVPPAVFNGYVEGWPVVFFFVYHYIFFLNVSVRKRLYGYLDPIPYNTKWDASLPRRYTLLFCIGVTIGHWLAAWEGPELIRVPGGQSNVGIWALIIFTTFLHYHSTLRLAMYTSKMVEPTDVVQFEYFRWVRHPIYASIVLMFLAYFIALRAPISCLYIVVVCLLYYNQKAVLEESLMVEEFGEKYVEYMKRVPYRFFPFVY